MCPRRLVLGRAEFDVDWNGAIPGLAWLGGGSRGSLSTGEAPGPEWAHGYGAPLPRRLDPLGTLIRAPPCDQLLEAAHFHYYNWVDQFNTLGLGSNIPISNGSGSDSLLALMPETGTWVVLLFPYPLGFYSKGVDGRIDDPKAGWNNEWATSGTQHPADVEDGQKGTKPKLAHFQVRPRPARKVDTL